MNESGGRTNRRLQRSRVLHLVVAILAIFAMLPVSAMQTAAQSDTTITVTSFAADGTTPLPFVRFQVTDNSSGAVYGPFETPPGSAQVVFSIDLTDPNATFTIEEETPPPCGIAPDPLEVGPLTEGENLDIEFATDFDDGCNQGGLSAYKYSCPTDFDSSTSDYQTWSSTCTEPVNGSTFTFTRLDSGFSFDAVTGAFGIPGRAPYIGLDPGDYTIGESGGTGSPTVFCLTYSSPNPVEAPGYDSVSQTDLANNAVTVTLDNNRIACDFFYAQSNQNGGDDGDNGDDESNNGDDDADNEDDDDTGSADTGNGSIELHLAQCPAGYEPNNDIFNDCHGNGIEDVEFTIDGPDGYSDSADTVIEQSPGPGIVRFTGLDAGTYTIGDAIPGDFATTYVYCSLAQAEDLVPFEYNNTDGIDLDLGDGVDVICDWYTIPDRQVEGSTIEITNFTCEAGYDGDNATYSDFLDDCQDPTSGVTFTVAGDNTDPVDDTTNNNGRASFTDLPEDSYRVSEDVPGEFAFAYAFCSVNDGDTFQADTSDGNAYFLIDQPGTTIDCDWYNIPEDLSAGASVTIDKYQCPEGQSPASVQNCTDVIGGVTFEVTGPQSYDESDSTDNDGQVVFENLSAGNYVITEIPPDDPHVDVYVVSCSEGGNNHDFTYDDSTGLRINLKLGVNDEIHCNWYNIKNKPGPSGSITVEKFLCQGNDDNDYDWEADCTPYTLGADFDLLDSKGKTLTSGTTNGDGILVFTGLADAAYGLDETSADWCHAEADIVDPAGNVIVEDGENTNVFIYNCTTQRVNTLPSTGTGATASQHVTLGGFSALFGGFAGLGILLALRNRWSSLAVAVTRKR